MTPSAPTTMPMNLMKPLPPLPIGTSTDMPWLENIKYHAYRPPPRCQKLVPVQQCNTAQVSYQKAYGFHSTYPGKPLYQVLNKVQDDRATPNTASQNATRHFHLSRKPVGSSSQPATPKNYELEYYILCGRSGKAAIGSSFLRARHGRQDSAIGVSPEPSATTVGQGKTLHRDNIPTCLRVGSGGLVSDVPDDLMMLLMLPDPELSEISSQRVIEPAHPAQINFVPQDTLMARLRNRIHSPPATGGLLHHRESFFDGTRYVAAEERFKSAGEDADAGEDSNPLINISTDRNCVRDSVGFIEPGHLNTRVDSHLRRFVPTPYISLWGHIQRGVRSVNALRGWQSQ